MKPFCGGRQADNPCSVDVDLDVGRVLAQMPAPPGRAATPWKPKNDYRCRQQRAQPCAPHCTTNPTPAASRTPIWKQLATRP
ncbi:hypothetical protein N6P31_17445 [Pectobacterium betavasculorum]|uniref:hypothetical protein n=1 Tax=Pectobacterium betavasculorum TaxID=55207 RepID=UPI00313C304A